MSEAVQPPFGRNYGVPDVTTAWGARGILNDYGLDLLGDRMGANGPRKTELMAYLEENFGDLRERVAEMTWDHASSDLQTVFVDAKAIVVASTNASYGYLYLRAWFKADEIGAPDESDDPDSILLSG